LPTPAALLGRSEGAEAIAIAVRCRSELGRNASRPIVSRGGPEDDMVETELEEENVDREKYDGEKMPQDIRRCSWAWRDVSSTRDDQHNEGAQVELGWRGMAAPIHPAARE